MFNYTQLFIAILSILYFARVGNHLVKRTSWYLAPIILTPFLTSINENSFFSFLLSPKLGEYSLDNINQIVSFWFSGSYTAILLISLLFIAEKLSLSVLSVAALSEVWMIAIGSFPLLASSIGILNALPLIISILIALVVHTLKRKNQISQIIQESPMVIKSKSIYFIVKNKNVIMGIIYLIVITTFLINDVVITIDVISMSHIIRILSFWSLFIFMLVLFKSFNYKRLISYLPVLTIYLGLSLTGTSDSLVQSTNPASLDCMTSIALFPLLEYLTSLYYGLNTRLEIGFISISSSYLKLLLKICYIGLISSFTLYLLN